MHNQSVDVHLTKEHVRDVQPSALGCEDCLKTGAHWVHLRICMECGHVGCCDDSPESPCYAALSRHAAPDYPLV